MSGKSSNLFQKYRDLQCWQRYLLIIILLFVLYSGVGFLLVPLLIEKILPEKLTKALNRQVTLENVYINPYLFLVEVDEFEIRNRQGDNVFISLYSLFLDIQVSSLFKLAPVVKTCQVAGLEIRGNRINDSTYNFSDLLGSRKNGEKEDLEEEEREPFRFAVNNIEISDSAVYYYDAPYNTFHEIEEINISIPFISNLPSDVEIDVEPSFSAFINGKFFSSAGQTRPFAGTQKTVLQIELQDIALPHYLAYLPVDLGMEIRQAFLDCRLLLSYSLDMSERKYLGLEGEIGLRDVEMELHDGTHLFSLPRLTVELSPENLMDGKPHLASVELDSPVISLHRRLDGTLDIPEAGGSNTTAEEEQVLKNNEAEKSFDIRIDETRVLNGSFQLIDQLADTSVTVDRLSVGVKNFSLSENKQSDVNVQARINSSGILDVSGRAGVNPVQGSFDIDFAEFEVGSLQGYVDQYLHLLITDGEFNLESKVNFTMDVNGVNGQFSGKSSLENFMALEPDSGNPLCGWKSLHIDDVQGVISEGAVQVGEILFDGLTSHILIDQDGVVNVQKLLKKTGEESEQSEEKPVVDSSKKEDVSREISIGKIEIKNGEVFFKDNRVTPDYHSKLHELNALLTGVSTRVPASVALKGKLNTSELEISGTVQPLATTKSGTLRVDLDGVELSSMTPYSGKYIGRGIRKGKLSVNMDYTVDDRDIDGKNALFLDQLTLGDSVESKDAVSLPLDLAVALMQNRKGEINLNIPVQGNLDDPEFSIGGVVFKVIMNMIVKAATSPFALIGALIGSEEQLDEIVFQPGLATLDKSESDKLEKLVSVLYDRPGLKIDLAGFADPNSDRIAIHETLFRQQLKARKLEEMVKEGRQELSLEAIIISDEEFQKYLWQAYKVAPFEKEKNFVGMVKKIPPEDQEKMLRAFLEVGDDQLAILASKRASSVRHYLVDKKEVESERVFLVQEHGTTDGDPAGPARLVRLAIK
jgi:uncharacterized protein involved in outer membrane biogenesis